MSRPSRRRGLVLLLTVAVAATVVAVQMTPRLPPPDPSAGADNTTTSSEQPSTTTTSVAPVGPGELVLPPHQEWPPLAACPTDLDWQRSEPVETPPPVAGPVTMEVIGRLGGVATAATLEGSRLHAGVGTQVALVDVSDPDRPLQTALSEVLPGRVEDIQPVGDLLVVAVSEGGVAILDGEGLTLVSTVPLPGRAEAVAVDGERLYVVGGTGGLRIIDITDPQRPQELAALLDLHLILDVAVAGDRVYLAAADEGLIVVDVTDPHRPAEVGRLFTGGYAYGVTIAGDRVLLADGWGGLRVIDPATGSPRLVATVPTEGWVLDVEVEGSRVYLADGNRARVVDISDPDAPRLLETMDFVSFGNNRAGFVIAIDVSGRLAVAVDDTAGIRLLEVGANGLAERGLYAPLGPPAAAFSGLAISGDRAYLAAGAQGAPIIDISDPRRPIEVARMVTEHPAVTATATGGKVFIGTATPAVIGIDTTTDPRPQVRVGIVPYVNVAGIATVADGSLLYTAAESGLLILDGGANAVCELGFLDAFAAGFESFTAVGVAGHLIYMGGDQFWIIDISDPRTPRLVDTAGVGEGIYKVDGMVVVGQALYAMVVAEVGHAVAVYDLTDPMEPRLQGLVPLPVPPPATSFVRGPVYGGGLLWVANGAAGLVAVDVSDPTRPVLAGRLSLAGEVMGAVVEDDLVYVISPGGGFFVVDWSTEVVSAHSGESAPVAVLAVYRPGASPQHQTTQTSGACLVTSTGDAGPGTLRACVETAPPSSTIGFDPQVFLPQSPATIRLQSPLPPLPEQVIIDGTGAGVVLDGGDLAQPGEDLWASNDWQGGDHGLRVGSGSVIRGLTITGFSGTGIFVQGGDNTITGNVVSANGTNGIVLAYGDNQVTGNFIGLDPSGGEAWGAQRQGIWVAGSDRNLIGGPQPEDRNVISGNQLGIVVNGSDNTIQGNYIGTDAGGGVMIGNDFNEMPGQRLTAAVSFDCCSNESGGTTGNRVVGNVVAGSGISLVGPTTWFNEVTGNILGLDANGTRWLGDAGLGSINVGAGPSPFNRIGGSLPGEGNVGDFSIFAGDRHVVVLGNRLGVNATEEPLSLPQGYFGSGSIMVANPGAVIGGRSPEAGNVVVGEGITVTAGPATVLGNTVRAVGSPCCDPDEVTVGIRLQAGSGVELVANTIESVDGIGVRLGPAASGTVLRGNLIRDSATGVLAVTGSAGCLITSNRFEDNRDHARDEGTANVWDDGRRGNWWSDLEVVDADGDGIIDQPRLVPSGGVDRYPLARPP